MTTDPARSATTAAQTLQFLCTVLGSSGVSVVASTLLCAVVEAAVC